MVPGLGSQCSLDWDPDAPQGPTPQQGALSQAPATLLGRTERGGMGAASPCPAVLTSQAGKILLQNQKENKNLGLFATG